MSEDKPQNYVVIAIKLMGVWLLVQTFQFFSYSFPGVVSLIRSPDTSALLNLFLSLAPALVSLIGAYVFISKTDCIYALLGINLEDTESKPSFDLQQLVIAGIGIYTLSYSLPSLANSIIAQLIISNADHASVLRSTGYPANIVKHILSSAVGISLILYSVKLSNLLRLLRTNQTHLD